MSVLRLSPANRSVSLATDWGGITLPAQDELGGLEVAALLRTFDEEACLVGIKQFMKLMLGQMVLSRRTL